MTFFTAFTDYDGEPSTESPGFDTIGQAHRYAREHARPNWTRICVWRHQGTNSQQVFQVVNKLVTK